MLGTRRWLAAFFSFRAMQSFIHHGCFVHFRWSPTWNDIRVDVIPPSRNGRAYAVEGERVPRLAGSNNGWLVDAGSVEERQDASDCSLRSVVVV